MIRMRNPVQGVGSLALHTTCPAWGVSNLVTGRTEADQLRRLRANLATANSSTMRGPRRLAGELHGRRCQTANDCDRWVRGCFHVRSPEMRVQAKCARYTRNCACSGERNIRSTSLPNSRDSDVSRVMEVMTNAGSSAAAGWLPVPDNMVSQVLQTP